MNEPAFQRDTLLAWFAVMVRGELAPFESPLAEWPDGADENRLRFVGLITPDMPLTGPMFV